MYSSTKDFEKAVLDLLTSIMNRTSRFTQKGSYGIPMTDEENEPFEILAYCVAEGYLDGYDIRRNANHHVLAACLGNPHVTHKGLQFIDMINNKKLDDEVKSANSKSDKASLRANIAIAISLLGILVQLLANLDKIVSNAEWVISCLD